MSGRSESVLSWVLTLSAVVIAGALLHREVLARRDPFGLPDPNAPPTFLRDWEELLSEGIRVGPTTAPVTVVEFADLECPFCREFHGRLRTLRRALGDSVSYVFVHYPISGHRFAYPAARAAECAQLQGRFDEYVGAVYEGQDSLGLKSWGRYAEEALVSDSGAFARCVADTVRVARIDRGRAVGDGIDVRGTPTVIVNGWRFAAPPADSLLRRVAADLLAGRAPFKN